MYGACRWAAQASSKVVKFAFVLAILALGGSGLTAAEPPVRSASPAKGAWFLYDLKGGRYVRIAYLGAENGQYYVSRTFLGGPEDGHVDVHLAPRSLLGCTSWPPASGRTGRCQVKRRVGGRDHWTDVSYRVESGGQIQVPAGRFDVLRIDVELRTDTRRVHARPKREVWWYAPSLDWPVRYRFGHDGVTAALIDHGVALDGLRRRPTGGQILERGLLPQSNG
jgi:hypothetical protein